MFFFLSFLFGGCSLVSVYVLYARSPPLFLFFTLSTSPFQTLARRREYSSQPASKSAPRRSSEAAGRLQWDAAPSGTAETWWYVGAPVFDAWPYCPAVILIARGRFRRATPVDWSTSFG
ncbi:hypothetical protein BDY17DRAFT_149618 [Neohortaea acidophila]|uniref:Uncharacterized protein n=1 Tax=Neohortaea acidophila TaxID=245834 RepID=A0A6A6PTW0_9PEZI|nr:uncharacterized protein BDY17DRAFT_149618 [Neohortaea acidophila]KAF2483530.1 hypothetical protein BDY17DRAFT_149618 [Neohortaea acidophila]